MAERGLVQLVRSRVREALAANKVKAARMKDEARAWDAVACVEQIEKEIEEVFEECLG